MAHLPYIKEGYNYNLYPICTLFSELKLSTYLIYNVVFVHYFIPFVSVSAKNYENQLEVDFDCEL